MNYFRRSPDHDLKRTDFRRRQYTLAASAVWTFALYLFSDHALLLALSVLFLQTATDEARRYRKTGCALQTRRSIWKGTTPIDAAKRHLLGDWKYPFSPPVESV